MIGQLLSTVVKVATLPLDLANAALDIVDHGDGSKESRRNVPVLGDLEGVRDAVCDVIKEVDK